MFRAGGSKTQVIKKLDNQSLNPASSNDILSIEERIDKYLGEQHATLWGQFFEIHSTKGRRQAKEFLLDILIDLGLTNEMDE